MNIELLVFSILILLFSVIVHEVMHGWVALKFGDRTALNAGRITLNPIPHIDPIGTILMPAIFLILPLLGFGTGGLFLAWAKPVPVNPLNFSDIKKGELLTSAAGVLSNFGLAIIAAILYHVFSTMDVNFFIQRLLQFAVGINLMLGIFNLLPIPPLDGSKILMSQLPYHLAKQFEAIAPYGLIILFFLLYVGVIRLILHLVINPIHAILGVPPLF